MSRRRKARDRIMFPVSPPGLPSDSVYKSCWCEENIYLLAQSFLLDPAILQAWKIHVIFISNPSRTVCLWKQIKARSEDAPVIWDYHVVLWLQSESSSWIYDFDTTLAKPCRFESYLDQTFTLSVPETYQSCFRVIPAREYLDNFASDRSHMLSSDGVYMSPPPEHQALAGPKAAALGITHNLMSFVAMDEHSFGKVEDLESLKLARNKDASST
ncbi:N-terminal glutamine amidase-domain-containing protein [Mycena floridula]|nr:N-terminal glutamine amidase-domain-containing protein [Mycena floridula]